MGLEPGGETMCALLISQIVHPQFLSSSPLHMYLPLPHWIQMDEIGRRGVKIMGVDAKRHSRFDVMDIVLFQSTATGLDW